MITKDFDMMVTTMLLPFFRSFLIALSVTFMNTQQFAAILIMYTIVGYLAMMLSQRRYESGNFWPITDVVIELYLTYLMLLLTDYVQDPEIF
jgi:uncharacterized membrane protein YdjX (TVP38/TMEM64 family)